MWIGPVVAVADRRVGEARYIETVLMGATAGRDGSWWRLSATRHPWWGKKLGVVLM
jgi:hypothetical protein